MIVILVQQLLSAEIHESTTKSRWPLVSVCNRMPHAYEMDRRIDGACPFRLPRKVTLMDFSTLLAAAVVALGLLTFDTIRHYDRLVIEVTDLPRLDQTSIDRATIEQEVAAELNAISQITSVVVAPEIRTDRDKGIGMAVASFIRLDDLAFALENDLGYAPDRLRVGLFTDNGKLRAVVSGKGRLVGTFRHILIPAADEGVLNFVRRCALFGASYLAPYRTNLYLIQRGAQTEDFTAAVRLATRIKARLPNVPVSLERSLYDNLLGIVALFQKDLDAAKTHFAAAIADSPSNPVPILNAAFVEIQRGAYAEADARMAELIAQAPPQNPVLLSTAYMTQAAAKLGLRQATEADRLLETATRINPENSSAWDMWGDAKRVLGDAVEAHRLEQKAMEMNDKFENYAEIATLYFRLAWGENAPLTTSPFRNPEVVTFR